MKIGISHKESHLASADVSKHCRLCLYPEFKFCVVDVIRLDDEIICWFQDTKKMRGEQLLMMQAGKCLYSVCRAEDYTCSVFQMSGSVRVERHDMSSKGMQTLPWMFFAMSSISRIRQRIVPASHQHASAFR